MGKSTGRKSGSTVNAFGAPCILFSSTFPGPVPTIMHVYTYDALALGLMSKRARRQILGVRLEQHRPEVAIVLGRDGSGKIARVRLSYWRFSERNFTWAFCNFASR